MSDDLVKRLRDWSNNPNGRNPAMAPCDEAADRIQQLEAALQTVSNLTARWNDSLVSQIHETVRAALDAK